MSGAFENASGSSSQERAILDSLETRTPLVKRPLPHCRRFNLGDGMILTAALAGWLSYLPVLEVILLPTAPARAEVFSWGTIQRAWTDWLVFAQGSLIPLLMLVTVAFLMIRLRQARPSLAQAIRQPGMLGCLACVAVMLLGLTLPGPLQNPLIIPFVVLLAWIVAASRGWLRPEAGWIDRLGRTLAAFWCLAGLFSFFLTWLSG